VNRILIVAALGVVLSTAAPGRAEDDVQKKRAADLFAEGRAVLVRAEMHAVLLPGELDEACAKLEQSYALMELGHTSLNLAECHGLQGKTASAWKEYERAVEMARKEKFPEAERAATKGAADLEARLSFLTITVPPDTAELPGFEVTRNGYAEPLDAWGKAVPVDPGTFEIAARADGYQPFSATSTVGPNGDKREVTVTLAPVPVAASSSPTPVVTRRAGASSARPIGFVWLGAGGVGLTLGAVAGLLAIVKHRELVPGCPGGVCQGEPTPVTS
jgi:hypothetical protein